MLNRRIHTLGWALVALWITTGTAQAQVAEFALLTDDNRNDWVPSGKEVDAITGDYVLRNDSLVAVIAQPLPGRNANMTVRNVGGMLIDLTRRQPMSDQLSCYYATAQQFAFHNPERVTLRVDGDEVDLDQPSGVQGETVMLTLLSAANQQGLQCRLDYVLSADATALQVTTTLIGNGSTDESVTLRDAVRADRTFEFGVAENDQLFWFADRWFHQAYGVTTEDRAPEQQGGGRGAAVEWKAPGGDATVEVAADAEVIVTRHIFPAQDTWQLRTLVQEAAGKTLPVIQVAASDPQGQVAEARMTIRQGDTVYAEGWLPAGQTTGGLPNGTYTFEWTALGRPAVTRELTVEGPRVLEAAMEAAGHVQVTVVDGQGAPIPCKVGFVGRDGTPDPDFGPDSGTDAIKNLRYTPDGEFVQTIAPGRYDLVISHGPEYDAVVRAIDVQRGETTSIEATLVRVVDSTGWVSTEYHSHSTPSGDNTSDQAGRVLNLLAEHLEFAPCTEHNRIDTYVPHLERFNAIDRLATCTGMELTGGPLPVNHQNAFPLVMKPFRQDNGAPLTDQNPVVQIARLAMWDDGAPKLVQSNHPNLRQIYGDRNTDGEPDEGFREMFGYMDVMEVHPPADIFNVPSGLRPSDRGNVMFNWMQLLNLGYRIPGVVNTDAHYNFHGSGWLRNYVASSTDDPTQIDVDEMVRHSEQGKIVMTTGPFLEVRARAGDQEVTVGEDLLAADGQVELQVKVQCPNWLDVNRVQVFVNGRPVAEHDYRRRTHPDKFGNGVVKFEQTIPLQLDADAHVIVATIGEGLELGRVMGPEQGKLAPCAVGNPIFVDVDGDGFEPSGDDLGQPLPAISQ